MFANTFERALAPVDDWLSQQGRFSYLGLALTPLAIGLAASVATSMFMRKFGTSPIIERKLRTFYSAALVIWTALSLLVIGLITKPAGFPIYALGMTAEVAAGCALTWFAIAQNSRKFLPLQMPEVFYE
jgi:hypothetical protein